jgi:hypothetical protein
MSGFDGDESLEDAEAYAAVLRKKAMQQKRDAHAAIMRKLYETNQPPDPSMQEELTALFSGMSEKAYKKSLLNVVSMTIQACFQQLSLKVRDLPKPVDEESRKRLRGGIVETLKITDALLTMKRGIDPDGKGEYNDLVIGQVRKLKDFCHDMRSKCYEDFQTFIQLI